MSTYRLTQAARKALAGELLEVDRDPGNAVRLRTLDDEALVMVPEGWVEMGIPDEPEPGAYLISGVIVLRLEGERGPTRWINGESGWARSWPETWDFYGGPGVEIVPLVPAVKP